MWCFRITILLSTKSARRTELDAASGALWFGLDGPPPSECTDSGSLYVIRLPRGFDRDAAASLPSALLPAPRGGDGACLAVEQARVAQVRWRSFERKPSVVPGVTWRFDWPGGGGASFDRIQCCSHCVRIHSLVVPYNNIFEMSSRCLYKGGRGSRSWNANPRAILAS